MAASSTNMGCSSANFTEDQATDLAAGSNHLSMRKSLLRVLFWVVNFLVPIALFIFASVAANVYPFGSNSFLTEDLKYQYIDFFAWFQNVLSGEASIFYSSAQALGSNTWGLFSYYLSSPFNLLVVFFDEYHLTEFVYLITSLKLGCIQIAFTAFLKKRFGLSDGKAALLALCFVWSSWTASQLRNPLWLDSLTVLPIMCLAVYRFINDGKWKLLLGSLVTSIIVCWYIAYMSILFVSLYLIFEYYLAYIGNKKAFDRKVLLKKVFIYVGILILSLLLCAWTFLPTILSMVGDASGEVIGVETQSSLETLLDHKTLLLFAALAIGILVGSYAFLLKSKKLSPRSKVVLAVFSVIVIGLALILISRTVWPNVTTGSSRVVLLGFFFGTWEMYVTQLFAGTIVLLLVIMFLLNKAVDLRIKVAASAFLILLVLSTWANPLYFAWCGMRQPNGFYCRISEFAILIMIWIAAFYLSYVQSSKPVDIATGVKSSFGKTLSSEDRLFGKSPDTRIYLEGGFRIRDLIIACALLIGVFLGFIALGCYSEAYVGIAAIVFTLLDGVLLYLLFVKHLNAVAVVGLFVVAFFELLFSAYLIWIQLYVGYSQEQVDVYNHEARAQWAAISQADEGEYRFNRTYRRAEPCSFNEGMAIGFNELSSYSSAHNGNAIKFLSAIGFSREGEFSVGYDTSVLVPESLLGCKYITSESQPFGYITTSFPVANGGCAVYQNPYALPIGYGVSTQVESASLEGTENPFERQNLWISALLGHEVEIYSSLQSEIVSEESADGDMISRIYEVLIPENGVSYAYVSTHSAVQANVSIDGIVHLENERFNQAPILMSGEDHETEIKQVLLSKVESYAGQNIDEARESPDLHAMDCVFYSLDMDGFKQAMSSLTDNPFNVDTFKDGYIKGNFTKTADDETLLLTIPCESGWTVKVNGGIVNPSEVFDGAMMSIPVQTGENEIEMEFVSPGFIPGCAISLVAISGLIIAAVIRSRKKHV